MQDLNLTQDEIDLILHHRKIADQQKKDDEFRKLIAKTTYEWLVWSENNGKAGLTFSTFVDDFCFEGENKSVCFNAIKEMLQHLKQFNSPKC